jgi:hypothetical protein
MKGMRVPPLATLEKETRQKYLEQPTVLLLQPVSDPEIETLMLLSHGMNCSIVTDCCRFPVLREGLEAFCAGIRSRFESHVRTKPCVHTHSRHNCVRGARILFCRTALPLDPECSGFKTT